MLLKQCVFKLIEFQDRKYINLFRIQIDFRFCVVFFTSNLFYNCFWKVNNIVKKFVSLFTCCNNLCYPYFDWCLYVFYYKYVRFIYFIYFLCVVCPNNRSFGGFFFYNYVTLTEMCVYSLKAIIQPKHPLFKQLWYKFKFK